MLNEVIHQLDIAQDSRLLITSHISFQSCHVLLRPAMVHLIYIIITSYISVQSCHILLRPGMVHLIYIIITTHIIVLKHNLLIFTVLRPTGISTYKASNKQVLTKF
jgi:exopolysaccharide biosynthesis predicted pyruvyltransferase EpsI